MFGGFPKSADCCEPMHCEQSLKLVGSNPSACKNALQSISLDYKQKPVQICKAGEFICSAGTSLVTISVGGWSTVKCRVRTSGCAKDCSGPHKIPGLIKFEDYKCKWSVGVSMSRLFFLLLFVSHTFENSFLFVSVVYLRD